MFKLILISEDISVPSSVARTSKLSLFVINKDNDLFDSFLVSKLWTIFPVFKSKTSITDFEQTTTYSW